MNIPETIAQSISLPQEVIIFLLASLPVTELRGAIPFALGFYDMGPGLALALSIAGNMLPVFFVFWFLEHVSEYLIKNSTFFAKLFEKIFERTRRRAEEKFTKYGIGGLILLVAIPLPMTGAWTGTIAAWLFGLPFKKAISPIFIGVVIAGVIVTLLSLGIFSIT